MSDTDNNNTDNIAAADTVVPAAAESVVAAGTVVDAEAAHNDSDDTKPAAEAEQDDAETGDNAATHSVECIADGTVWKRGGTLKLWKKRRVVVGDGSAVPMQQLASLFAKKPDSIETIARLTVSSKGFLLFTDTVDDDAAGETVPTVHSVVELAKITAVKAARALGKDHAFIITTAAEGDITLAASDDKQRDNWLYTIETSMAAVKGYAFDTSSQSYVDALAGLSAVKQVPEGAGAAAAPAGLIAHLAHTLKRGKSAERAAPAATDADVTMEDVAEPSAEHGESVKEVPAVSEDTEAPVAVKASSESVFSKLSKRLSRASKKTTASGGAATASSEPAIDEEATEEVVEEVAEEVAVAEAAPEVETADEKPVVAEEPALAENETKVDEPVAPVITEETADEEMAVKETPAEEPVEEKKIEVEAPAAAAVKQALPLVLLSRLSSSLTRKSSKASTGMASSSAAAASDSEVVGDEKDLPAAPELEPEAVDEKPSIEPHVNLFEKLTATFMGAKKAEAEGVAADKKPESVPATADAAAVADKDLPIVPEVVIAEAETASEAAPLSKPSKGLFAKLSSTLMRPNGAVKSVPSETDTAKEAVPEEPTATEAAAAVEEEVDTVIEESPLKASESSKSLFAKLSSTLMRPKKATTVIEVPHATDAAETAESADAGNVSVEGATEKSSLFSRMVSKMSEATKNEESAEPSQEAEQAAAESAVPVDAPVDAGDDKDISEAAVATKVSLFERFSSTFSAKEAVEKPAEENHAETAEAGPEGDAPAAEEAADDAVTKEEPAAPAMDSTVKSAVKTMSAAAFVHKMTGTLSRFKKSRASQEPPSEDKSVVVASETEVAPDAPETPLTEPSVEAQETAESSEAVKNSTAAKFSLSSTLGRVSKKFFSKDVKAASAEAVPEVAAEEHPAESVAVPEAAVAAVIDEAASKEVVEVVESETAAVEEPATVPATEESKEVPKAVDEVVAVGVHADESPKPAEEVEKVDAEEGACSPTHGGAFFFGFFNRRKSVAAPAAEPVVEGALMSGWLEKQSAFFKFWNRRYFALVTGEDGAKQLTYYRPSNLSKPAGVFSELQCTAEPILVGGKAQFKIGTAKQSLRLAAADMDSATKWGEAIKA